MKIYKTIAIFLLMAVMCAMPVCASEQTANATVTYTCEDSFFVQIPEVINVGEECSINAVEINISPNKAVYVDLALSPDEYVTIHSENSDDTLDVYFVNSDGEPLSVTNMTLARFDSGSENSSQTFSTYVSETTGKTAGVYTGTAMFNIYCD